jgi:hypothetical protein
MSIFKENWTPAEADGWSAHDVWATVLSVAAYVLVLIGTARAILLQWDGFVMLVVGAVCIVVMFKVINPKLRAISTEYEKKQKDYLDQLERQVRREE